MISNQFKLDINNELIIDNFAGGGGASTGIELALGRHVDIAINHDAKAIAMHAANHPQTKHYCENIWDVDPREVSQGRPIGLVWLSPDCKHFSKAKGGKPVEKKIRGLAWVALKWASLPNKPRIIKLENVEEFVTWGPLDSNGKPCKKNKGREFNAFVNALKSHGYQVEHKELRACDYGAPTIRKRFFLIARCDGQPIVWPDQTHYNPKIEVLRKRKRGEKRLPVWRTAADCIDWSIPVPSIFERKKDLADNTLRRVAKGVMRYVVNAADPFIVTYYGPKKDGEFRGIDMQSPLPTQTTENRFALVKPVLAPFISEHANASSQRNMSADEPLRTQCAQVKGGHFSLVTALLAQFNTTGNGKPNAGHSLSDPMSTVMAGSTVQGIVTAHLMINNTGHSGSKANNPVPTITTGGQHTVVECELEKNPDVQKALRVAAFIISYYGTDNMSDPRSPAATITTRDRLALVTVTIQGEDYLITDICLRMLQPRELFKAQGFPDNYIIGDDESQGLKLTKTEQVRMVGNSVSPPLSKSLVQANLIDMRVSVAA